MASSLTLLDRRLRAPVVVFVIGILAGCGEDAPPLPALTIDPQRVTVSGVSSGAYMAHQVHLAYSSRIHGAGLIAGGPYACAADQLDRALKLCTQTLDEGPDVASLADKAKSRAAAKHIDPLDGLAEDRVWIFHGDADTTVAEAVTAATAPLYSALSSRVRLQEVRRAGVAHSFPTLSHGADCGTTQSPFLGNCSFDAAGEIFRHVVQVNGTPAAQSTGSVHAFNQDALLDHGKDAMLSDTGYVYVPAQCAQGICGLHLAFHGCQQSADRIDNEFVEHAGYNRWADLAGVVVVYPQTRSSLMPLNPKGCWDWWGYTGSDYDTVEGVQIAWVGRLLDRLGVRASL